MTILSEKIVSITNGSNAWMFCVLFSGFFFLTLLLISLSAESKKYFYLVIITFTFIAIFLYTEKPQCYDYKQYNVLIDDNVGFHEIMDNYDLIRVEGSIYTIREKTPENGD